MMRPGVATMISGPFRSAAACADRESPPTIRAALMSVNCASFEIIEWICTASSRVGVKIIT
jgi:hypothetical protein